jgi:NADH dehydrogenase
MIMSNRPSLDAKVGQLHYPAFQATDEPELRQIVIGCGGADGLQLATTLGDRLGRRRKAQVTPMDRSKAGWKAQHLDLI